MFDRLLRRLGSRYFITMMVLSRPFGTFGGMLVIYYVELTLKLPAEIRSAFRREAAVVVLFANILTFGLALYETRNLRKVLKAIHDRTPFSPELGSRAGREAVVFAGRHHWLESWLVPISTLVPVLLMLKFIHDASASVMLNITAAVFMGTAMALMSTFFVVEHAMKPVIRRLLERGITIDYRTLPPGKLRFRLRLCFTLIIMTTALMIGTLARQRATDLMAERDPGLRALAVTQLKTHTLLITVAAVITGIVYSTVLSNSVATRVGALVQAMERVGAGNLAERLQPTGNDEIDILARQFNAMVQRLEHNHHVIQDLNQNLELKVMQRTQQLEMTVRELKETQGRLTDLAHRAGMAEIATGVLHNLGNVLNSVNISTTVLRDRLRRSKLDDLHRLSHHIPSDRDALEKYLIQEQRAEKMVDYLRKVCETLFSERDELQKELSLLTDNVDHIRGIINAQQSYARQVSFQEEVDICALVRNILKIYGHSMSQHKVDVVTDFDYVPPGYLEKVKVAPVLENLIKNALEAMSSPECKQRVLTVKINPVEPGRVRVTVTDTGCGIEPEDMKKLFSYGFTTKPTGNGFGLHTSALALRNLGGNIEVHSDGRGKGSTFIAEFPFAGRGEAEPAAEQEPQLAELPG